MIPLNNKQSRYQIPDPATRCTDFNQRHKDTFSAISEIPAG